MNLMKKIICHLGYRGVFDGLDDKSFLSLYYWCIFGKKLNWDNPKTFSEKLQWLKLYDRRDEYTTMVDKYEVKKYVADCIGKQYIIPTLGVWNQFDEIDFDSLPEQFVLKCTHDSGGLVICKDKAKLNKKVAKDKIERSLKKDYYLSGREWPYKNVKRLIIAEQYMEDSVSKELRDYKFFCFNGEVRCFKIDFDRYVEHHANYYSRDCELLPFGEAKYPPLYDKKLDIPSEIPQMIILAEKLARKTSFVRIDFYDVDGKIYFGEITFYPASGLGVFTSAEWDKKLGDWILLADVKK